MVKSHIFMREEGKETRFILKVSLRIPTSYKYIDAKIRYVK